MKMDHYQFYIVMPQSMVNNLVPAHWGLPVSPAYPKDDGNRDIIFGGYTLGVDGNFDTWRRPTWKEVAQGVANVHGKQLGPPGEFIYTYPNTSTVTWFVAKFVHPHLPSALPLAVGGQGLFSLLDNVTLSGGKKMIEATIQECVDDQTTFYSDRRRLVDWMNQEIDAGNLTRPGEEGV